MVKQQELLFEIPKDAPWFIQMIISRLFLENKNFLLAIVGETGQGKSYSAIKICQNVMAVQGKTWDLEKYLIFRAKDFFQTVKTVKEGGYMVRGDMILADEWGVGMPARDFQSITNKALDMVLQTFRKDNVGVIFTLPVLAFMDIHARSLLHAYIHILQQRFGKFYLLNVDHYSGQIYRKFKKEFVDFYGLREYGEIKFGLVDDATAGIYEPIKGDFVSKIKKEGLEKVLQAEGRAEGAIRANDILYLWNEKNVFDGIISQEMNLTQMKEMAYVQLQNLFPYRPIVKSEVNSAVRVWRIEHGIDTPGGR